jgi:FAD/FMN-containing dehydrogenase/Fe-S oxidoreductase
MDAIFNELKKEVEGDIHFDPITCAIYSVDASIYEIKPLGIIAPKNKKSLIKALQIAFAHKIPVTARGAATGITGACLGHGLIIDTSRYLNNILEINIEKEYAICEPGVVQDTLNAALAPFGYRLGPDTSTGNRATLGGMMANNSAGARSLFYGCMADHVEEIELALAGGELLTFRAVTEEEWARKREKNDAEGKIYNEVQRLIQTYRQVIDNRFPKIPRHVSGYNLDKLLQPPLNLCKLITGSEGTLGIATKIKVKIAKKPRHTGLCIIHLNDMLHGMRFIKTMLAYQPMSLEMIDDKIIEAARLSPAVQNKLGWLSGNPQAVFVAEFEGDSPNDVDSKLYEFSDAMEMLNFGYASTILTDPAEMAAVWEVRKAGLGLLLSKKSYSRAIAFIEDLSIAPEKLSGFMHEFCTFMKTIGKEAGIYGHVGSGCMHIRPYIDLRKKEEVAVMEEIMDDVSTMVQGYRGAMSGEHGDGLIRSWLNEKMFGSDLYQVFKDIKAAFDPHHLMNPGKITDGPPLTENLRLTPESKLEPIPTFLDFSNEGGFELAADLCNGNGMCRKMENVMCPSFQASNDEFHTTRARAQTLRSIIHGKLPMKELTGQGLMDVLDLCIECKGCKKECPSQVDMAKMKSEMLYQYQEKHGYSLRSRLFASLHRLNRFASPFARFFNAMTSYKILFGWFGIAPQRSLPPLAHERFSVWFKKQKQSPGTKKVVLFNDTFTEYNEPEIGKAAFKILSALGYEIVLADNHCCGRPLISKGFLKEAKANALKVVNHLHGLLQNDVRMIVLEPSCASAFRDDYNGLLGKNQQLQHVISHTVSFDEFMQGHLQDGKLPLAFADTKQEVWVHGHCHQKALVGMNPTLNVLKGVNGFDVHEIDSGCCGMAGSFGYEKEHYSFSMKIGELKLFPAVRRTNVHDLIVSSGMSCRSQISDGTERHALHLAEAIASQMKG